MRSLIYFVVVFIFQSGKCFMSSELPNKMHNETEGPHFSFQHSCSYYKRLYGEFSFTRYIDNAWFEPRGYFISRWIMIVRANVVQKRTVVDTDWRFHNVCGGHLQSESESKVTTKQVVETSVSVNNSPIKVHAQNHIPLTYIYFVLNNFIKNYDLWKSLRETAPWCNCHLRIGHPEEGNLLHLRR